MGDGPPLLQLTLLFLLYVSKALLPPALDCIAFFFDNPETKMGWAEEVLGLLRVLGNTCHLLNTKYGRAERQKKFEPLVILGSCCTSLCLHSHEKVSL